jgi:hypothetical protein
MIGLIISALLAGGPVATATRFQTECVSIYFVGFSRSNASLVSGDTRWEGMLNDHDPSTGVSAAFRLCPVDTDVTITTVSGVVTVSIPQGVREVHILIDSRNVGASRASERAPLLD